MNNVKRAALLAALSAAGFGLLAQLSPPQDLAGDWQGTLKPGGGVELRLALHIKNADGGFAATLDSLDQPGANGIPVSAVTLKGVNVSFKIAAIGGSYEGKLDASASSIDGTWSQGQSFPLTFKRNAPVSAKSAVKPATPSDIDGTWMGTLDVGGSKLRVVFHILNTADGLTATTDSPDQGGFGIPVSTVTRNGSALKLDIKSIGGVYEGKISADRTSIDGMLSQGGGTLPLVLKPVKGNAPVAERRRPQNPVKPYPYHEEDLIYKNESAGIDLAATLTLPNGPGPFPAVVLITGSGPQDRDESLLGHKPFLVLSDYLTRRGIAVLRADDRGAGKSGGIFATSTTADFATDAEAGLAYLKTRTEINSRKLGLIGHSEGGMIAPMVAARNPSVAFIVMMAGPGVPGDQILPAQVAAISESSGMSHEEAMKHAENEREVLTLIEQGASSDAIWKKWRNSTARSPRRSEKPRSSSSIRPGSSFSSPTTQPLT